MHGKSRHEEDLKRILLSKNYPDVNAARDADNRYRAMRIFNPRNDLQANWDPEEWYRKYRDGIGKFSHFSSSFRVTLLRRIGREPGFDESFA